MYNTNKVAQFEHLPFWPVLSSIIVISFILSTLVTLLCYAILSRLMEISALKPVLRNNGNSQRNEQKTVEKLRKNRKVNLKKNIL